MTSRILKANDHTLVRTFYDADGAAADLDAVPTVTVDRENGTNLVDAVNASNPTGTGNYSFALTAASHTDELDVLKVTWDGARSSATIQEAQYVEVAGAEWASVAELRDLPELDDTTKYPTARVRAAAYEAELFFEDVTGVAWVPRYARDTLDGTNTAVVRLKHKRARTLRAVTIDGSAIAAGTIAGWHLYENGRLERDAGTFRFDQRNVVVTYEHGHDGPPADLRRAFLEFARHLLVSGRSVVDDRTVNFTDPAGFTFNLSQAGPAGRWTGLPTVDAVLRRYVDDEPLVR